MSGSTAARLLGSMISEGTEEGLQELLEPAFAAIIFDEEYEADFEDAAYAFLLGALSAGIIEGPAAIAYARRPAGFSFRDMDGYADNGVDYFEGANTLEEVEARYRDLARQYHPDVGGDTAIMAEINRQRTMARAFFRGRAEAAQEEEQAEPQRPEAEDGVIRRLNAPRRYHGSRRRRRRGPRAAQTERESGSLLPRLRTPGTLHRGPRRKLRRC
ncbi:MAG: J domain-containing protein [Lachnospiraceae bacterium]